MTFDDGERSRLIQRLSPAEMDVYLAIGGTLSPVQMQRLERWRAEQAMRSRERRREMELERLRRAAEAERAWKRGVA